MTSKLTRLTDDELTETLRQATSGYPLPASVEGNLRHAFAELQERRKAAMDSEPVFFIEVEGDDWINAGRIEGRNRPDLGLLPDGINYLYAAQPPVPELTATVERLNASGYEYEGGEVTPQNVAAVVVMLLQQLDDAVQCRNAQPAPVVQLVPEEPPEHLLPKGNSRDATYRRGAAIQAWKQCRAAMLQAGNSPVIGIDMASGTDRTAEVRYVAPPGYVMAPKEPTDEMIAAAMNCDDVLFNSDESFCVQFGNIYEAMLAAAPPAPNQENI